MGKRKRKRSITVEQEVDDSWAAPQQQKPKGRRRAVATIESDEDEADDDEPSEDEAGDDESGEGEDSDAVEDDDEEAESESEPESYAESDEGESADEEEKKRNAELIEERMKMSRKKARKDAATRAAGREYGRPGGRRHVLGPVLLDDTCGARDAGERVEEGCAAPAQVLEHRVRAVIRESGDGCAGTGLDKDARSEQEGCVVDGDGTLRGGGTVPGEVAEALVYTGVLRGSGAVCVRSYGGSAAKAAGVVRAAVAAEADGGGAEVRAGQLGV
jgi:hypothetical protein